MVLHGVDGDKHKNGSCFEGSKLKFQWGGRGAHYEEVLLPHRLDSDPACLVCCRDLPDERGELERDET